MCISSSIAADVRGRGCGGSGVLDCGCRSSGIGVRCDVDTRENRGGCGSMVATIVGGLIIFIIITAITAVCRVRVAWSCLLFVVLKSQTRAASMLDCMYVCSQLDGPLPCELWDHIHYQVGRRLTCCQR